MGILRIVIDTSGPRVDAQTFAYVIDSIEDLDNERIREGLTKAVERYMEQKDGEHTYFEPRESLLNPYGQYAADFAKNHGISIAEAYTHPTVQARYEYYNRTGK